MTARIVSKDVVFDGWYQFYRLMVEMPDGGIVERELMHHGSAVAVLPYDPERRVMMLITQPRPGPLFRQLPSPYEAIAGSLDGADPSQRILAEAMEEAGVQLDALEPLLICGRWFPRQASKYSFTLLLKPPQTAWALVAAITMNTKTSRSTRSVWTPCEASSCQANYLTPKRSSLLKRCYCDTQNCRLKPQLFVPPLALAGRHMLSCLQ